MSYYGTRRESGFSAHRYRHGEVNTPQRIQKIIALQGIASRRGAEQMIRDGRVRVDGRLATLGDRITPGQSLTVDGRAVSWLPSNQDNPSVIIYHKPDGELCTHRDPKGRRTVFDSLAAGGLDTSERWLLVGRLDFNTSGLLLLTTSGALANRIAHPSFGLEREYLCRVHGRVSASSLQRLTAGVQIDGKPARFNQIHAADSAGGANRWYRVVITEGRYREVRKLWESVGATVTRLKRIRFGPQTLPKDLPAGQWRYLSASELHGLSAIASDHADKDDNG